ncbi:MAG: hypothetical protein QNJ12_20065 [Ilumatobacter sp.]|uniref:hypothetical protein n=1 Tax=Ilumatobacter sp. TaxID=1967498 RepID=UPI00260D7BD1|nr:hypothetical protein [Ilumatobacter sp.]MDJ0771096.1 hypothetical protein [Ilumatobacter sp.]
MVRDDLVEAHRLAWEHIAAPGSWWTGEQRVELARTVLLAIADVEPLPPWVGVAASGRLPDERVAADVAHDIAYRLGRHAGTMTEDVYRAAADQIGELPYVEICAIASSVAAVAHFSRNIGTEVPPLPAPVPGEPTALRPDDVVQPELNWVPVAAPADQTAAVVQAYSAVPGELANTWRMAGAQYMPSEEMVHPDWSRRAGGLSRPQMELVAARVAQLRECFY